MSWRQFTHWALAASLAGILLLIAAAWHGPNLNDVARDFGGATADTVGAAAKLSQPAGSLASMAGRTTKALVDAARTATRPLASMTPLAELLLGIAAAAMLAFTFHRRARLALGVPPRSRHDFDSKRPGLASILVCSSRRFPSPRRPQARREQAGGRESRDRSTGRSARRAPAPRSLPTRPPITTRRRDHRRRGRGAGGQTHDGSIDCIRGKVTIAGHVAATSRSSPASWTDGLGGRRRVTVVSRVTMAPTPTSMARSPTWPASWTATGFGLGRSVNLPLGLALPTLASSAAAGACSAVSSGGSSSRFPLLRLRAPLVILVPDRIQLISEETRSGCSRPFWSALGYMVLAMVQMFLFIR
jgi:hypothetical protein